MKKHDLDKLFKNNAGSGQFPYSESYWKDAEKLINNPAEKGAGGLSKFIITGIAILVFSGATLLSINAFQPSKKLQNTLAQPTIQINNNNQEPQENLNNKREAQPQNINNEVLNNKHNTATNTQNTTHKNEIQPASKANQPENDFAKTNAATSASATKSSAASFAASAKNKAEQPSEVRNTEVKTAEKSAEEKPAMVQSTSAVNDENNFIISTATSEYDVPEKTASNNAVENTNAATAASLESGNANTSHSENLSPKSNQLAETENQSGEEKTTQKAAALDEKSEEIPPDYPQIKPHRSLDDFTISAGPSFSYLLANRSLSANSSNYQNLRNDNETTKNINSLGVDVHIGYRNWLFSTGIFRTSFVENINYPSVLNVLETQDNSYWQLYDNWSYTTQTNWVIDSIYVGHLQTDTTWSVTQDSTFIVAIDSTYTDKEVPEMAKNNGKRTVSYVEIPVWFGRSFGANRFTIDVQGGVAFGFLTTTQGAQYINYAANTISTTADVVQQNTILYNAMLRAGVRFNITEKLDAGVYPTLRYNLNSVLNGEGINQRYFGYGLQVGLFYRF